LDVVICVQPPFPVAEASSDSSSLSLISKAAPVLSQEQQTECLIGGTNAKLLAMPVAVKAR
jgi:hypothetical protein